MGESENNLLDLSDWPAPPPVAALPPRQAGRNGLPPRPVRSRTLPLPRLSYKSWALLLAVIGLAFLVVPWDGCGAPVIARSATPVATPADTPPQLDDAELKRDAEAVAAAQAALAAWRPAPGPTAAGSPVPTTRTRTVPAADPQEVAAAQRRVDSAQDQVDADQAELDRVLAKQEASSDPASYDGQVASAREQLESSVAELDEARQDLKAARARTRTETVAAGSPAPRPQPTAAAPAGDKAALATALADARTQQAAHLEARQQAVGDWRSSHQADVTTAARHNARVKQCAARTAVPALVGAGCLLVAAGVVAAHTVRARLTP